MISVMQKAFYSASYLEFDVYISMTNGLTRQEISLVRTLCPYTLGSFQGEVHCEKMKDWRT